MFVEHWIFDKVETQINLDSEKYLKNFTKESLTLNKRQAKHLNVLFNILFSIKEKSLTCQNVQTFEIDSLLNWNNFKKVPRKVKSPAWNASSLASKCVFTETTKNILKEKLTLTKEDKLYLEEIITLELETLDTAQFEVTIPCLQDTSYTINQFPLSKFTNKQQKITITDRYIPSKSFRDIDQHLEELNEKEDFHVPSAENIIPKIPLIITPFDTTNQYLFHIDVKKQNKVTLPIDILTWEVKYKEQDSDIISTFFNELELKLFDIEFHKYEFFKLPCYQKAKNNPKKTMITTIWKLQNIQLKQMKWAPFKKWKKIEVYQQFQDEEISSVKFWMPTFTSNVILYLPNTDLDLYERGKGSMTNLQIDTKVILYDKNDKVLIETSDREDQQIPKDIINNNFEVGNYNNKNSCHSLEQSSILRNYTSGETHLTVSKKRSFIDSELQSIIEKKKSQMKSYKKNSEKTDEMSQIYSTREDITNIFQSDVFNNFEDMADSKSNERTENSSMLSQHLNRSIPLYKMFPNDLIPEYDIKDKLIIFNSNRIAKNYKLLQRLINHGKTNCVIIESDLSTNCDLILNGSTCVICLELVKFFQRRSTKDLYYLSILKECSQEYKRIKIIFQYEPDLFLYDSDIFWKIYLYLPYPRFELFFVPKGSMSVLVQCMNKLIWKEASSDISAEDFEDNYPPINTINSEDPRYESDDKNSHKVEDILLKLNFNPILAKLLVKKYGSDLTTIILQINNGIDPFLLKTMTMSQINRLKILNSINW